MSLPGGGVNGAPICMPWSWLDTMNGERPTAACWGDGVGSHGVPAVVPWGVFISR